MKYYSYHLIKISKSDVIMEKDEVLEAYRLKMYELKRKVKSEMMMSKDKITVSQRTKEELELLREEIKRYKLSKMEGKVK